MSFVAVAYPSIFYVVMWRSCGRIKAELTPENLRAKHFPRTRHHSHDIAQLELRLLKCTVLFGRQTRLLRVDGITTISEHFPTLLGTVRSYSFLLTE
jgi:hypothetical protein